MAKNRKGMSNRVQTRRLAALDRWKHLLDNPSPESRNDKDYIKGQIKVLEEKTKGFQA